ncbi:NAD(P)/FAD-dependent oxidoreductase [Carnobacteriaceae bacterium zg-ZUI78]|uniref:NAD(P)/FAD-dependent oxidoreductase n=1 Tax=Granulicatella sp. zg-84 TaxID=2678503 RepID=UPI0013C051A6|nr:NAD(P)/FAD-dependent oxidoreductase [Granulicatella sp. zg-84]MBS4750188.1 NAD(P)/FAD-dependent oxidoreductase [Carnobacteriaceae bacterium zg-ZUI78]NEW66268.1 aminoacetone oxidase family FAD-binding enzyme [Granulicatella sp. zg-84]QMI85644.1 NAD(P)/FAD-dependent oxidoreductase [Carnobacteriaceae bacterium zg-84]
MYDVIVIGGGSSGLMACVSAAKTGAKVLLLEKNASLGQKLLLTGGGRCNITNNRPAEEIVAHIPGNGRFLYSAFSQFDNYDIIKFFKENGVTLKEEDHGRMFPTTDKARTILDTFISLIKQHGIHVQTKNTVSNLLFDENKVCGVHLEDGTTIHAKSVIIATGGKSIPKTGSTGDGFKWAEQAGHTIVPLFPTEVPLTSSEHFIQQKTLQGLSLRNISLSVLNQKQKPIISHQMDMIFTHFGISGPAVLRCSSFVYKEQKKQKKNDIHMHLDCLPDISIGQLEQDFMKHQKEQSKKEIKTILKQYIPERLALFYLNQANLIPETPLQTLSHQDIKHICHLLKHFTFTVNGSLPLEKSFVTGGGVNTKEINPKTMMSKLKEGLYFCGEVLDIYGYTGGYNITSAFVTGYLSGFHAGQQK